ncbi:serine/threonine-protein kinase [Granulicella sp. S156]|uniref:serine/threonine-protein kinase n=1 Tax=Granulicella sp. S156 TaxID=1747224 RepID=UPI00131D48FE|nr:serine/threonine-protein kinase [Granulicella sp. S156]
MSFETGQRVGDYEILQMLGAGGMGHVYRVRNVISDRIEAMKVLLPDLAAEPDLAVRFISEIRTLASFDHPNIAQLHTAFQADNQLVMMMEFVEGFTLEHRGQQGAMPGGEVVQYISQTLSALSYAHARGVVHRDIKPANIMVTSHGIAKLMDFGIAKSAVDNNLTRPGTTMGSLYYMSPEQVRGTTVDARSDIYSIGIVLYELLAGHRPFEADTTFTILNKQLNEQPRPPIEVNPSLPTALNDIILTALAKDPAQRFQSADAFRNALKNFALPLSGEAANNVAAPIPIPSATPAPGYQPVPTPQPIQGAPPSYASAPPPPRSGGNKPLWIATGAIAVVLALVAIGFAVPHYMHTHAASSSTPTLTDTSNPPQTAPASTTPDSAPATPVPTADSTPPATPPSSPTPTPSTPMASSGNNSVASGTGAPHNRPLHNGQQGPANSSPAGSAPPPPDNSAELEQVKDQLIQLNARASAARHGVQEIRSQQEQMGLGLRGDIDSAESRLNAYLHAANDEVRTGNATAASRDMDKAEVELSTIEKFLGH